jgi:hypothetical protein
VALNLGLHNINRVQTNVVCRHTTHHRGDFCFVTETGPRIRDSSRNCSKFVCVCVLGGGGVPVLICDTSRRPGSMLFLVDSIILLVLGDQKRSRYQGRSVPSCCRLQQHSVTRAENGSRSYWFRCARKIQGNFMPKPTDALTHYVVNL